MSSSSSGARALAAGPNILALNASLRPFFLRIILYIGARVSRLNSTLLMRIYACVCVCVPRFYSVYIVSISSSSLSVISVFVIELESLDFVRLSRI